jgi:hypothetical protein
MTNCMMHSHFWESNSLSAFQKIPQTNPKVFYRARILRHVNPVPTYSYFPYNTRFNIILNPVVLPIDLILFLEFSSTLS